MQVNTSFTIYTYTINIQDIYIYIVANNIYINHSAPNVITCAKFRLKQTWQLTRALAEIKCEH